MQRNALVLFLLMALVQWGTGAWTVWHHNRVLDMGTAYRFEVQPIDPRDPFRGEYVTLSLSAANVVSPDTSGLNGAWGDVYGTLGIDTSGFAIITALSMDPPKEDHVRCKVQSRSSEIIWVELPFDRYYLEEGDGGHVEALLDRFTSDPGNTLPSFVVVRILNGESAVEQLVIGDRSVEAWMNDMDQER